MSGSVFSAEMLTKLMSKIRIVSAHKSRIGICMKFAVSRSQWSVALML